MNLKRTACVLFFALNTILLSACGGSEDAGNLPVDTEEQASSEGEVVDDSLENISDEEQEQEQEQDESDVDEQVESDTPVLTTITVDRQELFFSGVNLSEMLVATAYDQFGDEIAADISWQSSHPQLIDVDPYSGQVTSIAVGSAQIVAKADEVTASPVTVVFAKYHPHVVVVNDEQVISGPMFVDPLNPPTNYAVEMPYKVELTNLDIAPTVGTMLSNEGSTPFAGRVENVTVLGDGRYELILSVTSVGDIFAEVRFDEEVNIDKQAVAYSASVLANYSATQLPDGSIELQPRLNADQVGADSGMKRLAIAQTANTFAGARSLFQCKFTPENLVDIFKLDLGNSTVSITRDISVPLIITDRGLEKLSIKGELKAEFKTKFAFSAAVEPKVSCKMELGTISVPVPGPLGFLVGIQVPLGVGIDIAGKIKLADVGVELVAKANGSVEYGYQNPPECDNFSFGCGFFGTATSDSDTKLNFDPPASSLDGVANDITLEPSAMAYGYAVLAVGNPVFSNLLSIQLLEVRMGATQSANLATVQSQVANQTYKSDYKLTLDALAKPGETVEDALKFFKVASFGKFELKYSTPLALSPNAATLKVDVKEYEQGDTLNFAVTLDETNINYLPGFYNVDSVKVYEIPTVAGGLPTLLGTMPAFDGQREFNLEWIAEKSGNVENQFLAFVETELLPVPMFGELELGVFKSDTSDGNIQTSQLDYLNQVTYSGAYSSDNPIFTYAEQSTEATRLVNNHDQVIDMTTESPTLQQSVPGNVSLSSNVAVEVVNNKAGTQFEAAFSGTGEMTGMTILDPRFPLPENTCGANAFPCYYSAGSNGWYTQGAIWSFEVMSNPVNCHVTGTVHGAKYSFALTPWAERRLENIYGRNLPDDTIFGNTNMDKDFQGSNVIDSISVAYDHTQGLEPGRYTFYIVNDASYQYVSTNLPPGTTPMQSTSGETDSNVVIDCQAVE